MGNISFLRQWPTARLMMLTALMAVAMPKAVAQTEQDETDPAITKTSSPTAAIPMMICEWLCTN